MTDADLIAQLRTAVAYHETQAERYRRMLAIAEDDALVAPKVRRAPTAKQRSGEQRRPPSDARPRRGRKGADPQVVANAVQMAQNGLTCRTIAAKLGVPLQDRVALAPEGPPMTGAAEIPDERATHTDLSAGWMT